MADTPVLRERDLFDETAYLRLDPDIVKAISEGREISAWHHYDHRQEGRKPMTWTRTSTRAPTLRRGFAAKKGDVLVWHADLVYCGNRSRAIRHGRAS